MTAVNFASSSSARLVAVAVSLVVSVIFIAATSYLFSAPDSMLGAFMLDRHTDSFMYPFTVQNLMWVMFFVGCGELWIRLTGASREMEQLSRKLLPEDDSLMLRAQELGPIYVNVSESDNQQLFFLQRLIRRCILQFQASRSVSQANALFNSSLELYQHEMELKYNMLRYLVWLIPTLGFIGTVVGLAFALDYAGSVEDPQDPALLAEISGRLGVAFYTTLLALIQSAVLMFALHIAQGREETALNRSGQYCLDNLINRLYEK